MVSGPAPPGLKTKPDLDGVGSTSPGFPTSSFCGRQRLDLVTYSFKPRESFLIFVRKYPVFFLLPPGYRPEGPCLQRQRGDLRVPRPRTGSLLATPGVPLVVGSLFLGHIKAVCF